MAKEKILETINALVSDYEKNKNTTAIEQAQELLRKEIKKRQLPTDQSR